MQKKFLLVLILLFGLSLIPGGDTAGKMLTVLGTDPIFIAWSRLAIGFVLMLAIAGIKPSEIKQLYNWRLLLRAGFFITALCCILIALKTEALANVFGIFFIGPIVAYFLAAIVLKEGISLIRSSMLFIGFLGVLLVIKPSTNMGSGTLFALVAGVSYGSMLVCNRWLVNDYRPSLILLSSLCAGSIILAPFAIPQMPIEFDRTLIILVLISSLASAVGNFIIVEANRHLEASVVAPLVYTQLIAATLLGVAFFNEWPDLASTLGLGVIFASGILSFCLAKR